MEPDKEDNKQNLPSPAEEQGGEVDAQSVNELIKFAKASSDPRFRHLLMSLQQIFIHEADVDPLSEKVTSEHIGKALDYTHEDQIHSFELAKSNRIYHVIYFVGILAFLVFLFLTLGATDKSLLTEVIRMGILVAGGFGGGYGYKTLSDRRRSRS
jgi:hypothetical protein